MREEGNLGFIVQRADEDMIFKDIDFVEGNFNSNEAHNYSYFDYSAPNKTVYYRLQQLDVNAEKTLSATIAVEACNADAEISYFPNPVKNTLTINVKAQIEKETEVEIYNALGTMIRKMNFVNNTNHFEIDLQEFEAGNYFVRLNIDGVYKILKIQKS
jgi:hypothetical protein